MQNSGCWTGIMFAFSKVIDQLIVATLLKTKSIIDLSRDLHGLYDNLSS